MVSEECFPYCRRVSSRFTVASINDLVLMGSSFFSLSRPNGATEQMQDNIKRQEEQKPFVFHLYDPDETYGHGVGKEWYTQETLPNIDVMKEPHRPSYAPVPPMTTAGQPSPTTPP